MRVTPGFLAVPGVRPRLGRLFRSEENQPRRSAVAVISDGLWREAFYADPHTIAKQVLLDGVPRLVIGVLPASFADSTGVAAAAWVPSAVNPHDVSPARRMSLLGGVIGRLKTGVSLQRARAGLELLARQMDAQYPAPWLLLACANVGNLFLSHALTRPREIAIRVSVGASRWRVVRLLLVESFLVSVCGTVVGWLLMRSGVSALVVC